MTQGDQGQPRADQAKGAKPGPSRLGAFSPGGRRPQAGPQGAGSGTGIGLNLGGSSPLIWLAGGGLLAAALLSVGLFGVGLDTSTQHQPAATAGSSLIRPVAAVETEQAIGRLMMSEPAKKKVRAELADGKLRLGWITVSDNFDEDGDWVSITGAGFRQDVRLLHSPYTVAVPYLPGLPVTVTGLVDGGGGDITVSVYVGSAVMSLKPLKTGEVLQISSP